MLPEHVEKTRTCQRLLAAILASKQQRLPDMRQILLMKLEASVSSKLSKPMRPGILVLFEQRHALEPLTHTLLRFCDDARRRA